MHDVEASKVHTVFSAECNPTFDWHSIALFHSHKTSGQPGGITRLLACNKDELATYHGLSIGQPQARVRARARVRVRVRFRVILCFLVRGTQASVLASLLTLALTLAAGGLRAPYPHPVPRPSRGPNPSRNHNRSRKRNRNRNRGRDRGPNPNPNPNPHHQATFVHRNHRRDFG